MLTNNTNGSTYNPLCFAQDPVWMEWVAAMYETMQADEEYFHAFNTGGDSSYASTAHRLAEEIEEDTDHKLYELTEWESELIAPNAGSAE